MKLVFTAALTLALLPPLATARQTQRQALDGPPPGWTKLRADDVPDYVAWREFFQMVVTYHQNNGHQAFLSWMSDVADFDEETSSKVLEQAHLAAAVKARTMKLDQLSDRVRGMKGVCFDLENSLAEPESFGRIADYVLRPFKATISYLMEETPGDYDILDTFRSFDSITRQNLGRGGN